MHLPNKLDAADVAALSRSIRTLPAGERGWITMREAQALFSPLDGQYAFGDSDDRGKAAIAAFAAEAEHRSSYDFMPVEDRVYFTRSAPARNG